MRVLFVDDDPLIRRLGEFALGELGGMSVVTAHDGVEALAVVDGIAPDVILLDYLMPELNGDDVLAVLQASRATCSIPVVFLTAIGDEGELRELVAAGAIGHIAKPFDPETLAEELMALIGPVRRPGISGS